MLSCFRLLPGICEGLLAGTNMIMLALAYGTHLLRNNRLQLISNTKTKLAWHDRVLLQFVNISLTVNAHYQNLSTLKILLLLLKISFEIRTIHFFQTYEMTAATVAFWICKEKIIQCAFSQHMKHISNWVLTLKTYYGNALGSTTHFVQREMGKKLKERESLCWL